MSNRFNVDTRAYAEQLKGGLKGMPDEVLNFAKNNMHFQFFMDTCGKGLNQLIRNDPASLTAMSMMQERALDFQIENCGAMLRLIMDQTGVTREQREDKLPFLIMACTMVPYEIAIRTMQEHGSDNCGDPMCLQTILLGPEAK